jgi:hypothetical protein
VQSLFDYRLNPAEESRAHMGGGVCLTGLGAGAIALSSPSARG